MRVLTGLFSGSQHGNRPTTPTVANNSGSIRYKWPHRRKHTKAVVTNKDDPNYATSVWGVTLDDNSTSCFSHYPVETYPGLIRHRANECCTVCAEDVEYVYALPECGHRACLDCWIRFASSQVSSFSMANITCVACDHQLPTALVIRLLKFPPSSPFPHSSCLEHDIQSEPTRTDQKASTESLYMRYEDFILNQCLRRDKRIRWCPRGCGYAVLTSRRQSRCPRIECANPACPCEAFCYKCRLPWSSSPRNDGKHDCIAQTASSDGQAGVFANAASSAAAAAAGLAVGDNGGDHRTLLSRLYQLFRIPVSAGGADPGVGATSTAAAAVASASTSGMIGGGRGRVGEMELQGKEAEVDLEKGLVGVFPAADVLGSERKRSHRRSERRSSKTATVITSGVGEEVGTSGNQEDAVTAATLSDGSTPKVCAESYENLNGQIKSCPRCKTMILKLDDGSCNHMSCFICGCEFCWLCLREVRDTHFLSATGCTFWGRKRWPFRRRLCVMLLAAFGTPFILAVGTALAVPGIVVGFPAYLVYKVGQQTKGKKARKFLLKTLSFFGGLLVSPIISALATLFGVPLVLIYVYVFMPITLLMELKTRPNANAGNTVDDGGGGAGDPFSSSSTVPAIDPDVGFKLDWKRMEELTNPPHRNATASSSQSKSAKRKNTKKTPSLTPTIDASYSSSNSPSWKVSRTKVPSLEVNQEVREESVEAKKRVGLTDL